jgi:arsenical pump membrane protein
MNDATAEVLAVALLVLSLAFAVARPRGITEAAVAVPAAALSVVLGAVPIDVAWDAIQAMAPTVGFLAAVLVFAHLCAEAGVFDYLGQCAARASHGDPRRLLGLVVVLAAAVTATLTLDATVVLLTPVVVATTRRLRLPSRPHTFANARLANSGSLLMPVSNLTNLLAFGASGLSFGRFTALMALPWVAVGGAEWAALRAVFRDDLVAVPRGAIDAPRRAPRYALAVLGSTVVGFVVAPSFDVAVAWVAVAGCAALLAPQWRRREVHIGPLVRAASPGFCAFVLGLAIVVAGVARHGLGGVLESYLPHADTFSSLLVIALIAAVLANVVNNLPATLALVPVLAANPPAILAVLLGVNIGPNATYPGSLATLLWRRQLPRSERPTALVFHGVGLLTVPILLVIGTAALWLGLRLVGT